MKARMLFAMLLLSLSVAVIAAATPNGPTEINAATPTRANASPDQILGAQTGNVSRLDAMDNKSTAHWQGYYGNITGEITLDDSGNSTLYSWQLAAPSGEVYASNGSVVSWANITCVNLTTNSSDDPGAKSKINNSLMESVYNITLTDVDGINETFTNFYTGSFNVGDTPIATANGCYLAYMYINNASQSTNFQEVILTDNVSSVWTALIESGTTGYDGRAWDFEMIVPENSGDPLPTDFYFYVELT